MLGVRRESRPAIKAVLEVVAHATGLRFGGHVVPFVRDDVRARVQYACGDRRAEASAASAARTSDECFDFSRAYFGVGPVQHRSEIRSLLRHAEENGTRVACEIGAQDAGTSVMLSRALDLDTFIVMDLYVKNRWRLRRAAPPGQVIHVIDGDSTHPLTVRRLRRTLRGRKLDLLLIDGDHRWSGVRQDFINYRQFVRDGGLIAFHDIRAVRDQESVAWAGDVPAFWQLVSPIYPSREFVDSPDQQGLGIGVLRYDPARPITSIVEAVHPIP